ncbi:MAG: DUF1292 domain-containing protein [Erysipelotrichaceae bacterium]
MDVNNELIVIDEMGNELPMKILFTFENEEYGKQYVFYFDPNNDEEIFVSSYDDQNNLYDLESAEEFDMANEVLGAFVNDESDED